VALQIRQTNREPGSTKVSLSGKWLSLGTLSGNGCFGGSDVAPGF
jgi:hypothetical protein